MLSPHFGSLCLGYCRRTQVLFGKLKDRSRFDGIHISSSSRCALLNWFTSKEVDMMQFLAVQGHSRRGFDLRSPKMKKNLKTSPWSDRRAMFGLRSSTVRTLSVPVKEKRSSLSRDVGLSLPELFWPKFGSKESRD